MDTNTKYFNTLYPLEIINMINSFVGYCDSCNSLNKECECCCLCEKNYCHRCLISNKEKKKININVDEVKDMCKSCFKHHLELRKSHIAFQSMMFGSRF